MQCVDRLLAHTYIHTYTISIEVKMCVQMNQEPIGRQLLISVILDSTTILLGLRFIRY